MGPRCRANVMNDSLERGYLLGGREDETRGERPRQWWAERGHREESGGAGGLEGLGPPKRMMRALCILVSVGHVKPGGCLTCS